jgi:four helix bundle protein
MGASANPTRARLKAFALRITRVVSSLPQDNVGWVIGKQLLKSGTSIGANYCESRRPSSKAHFASILEISLREADESKYWLELLADSEIIAPHLLMEFQAECEEIIRILAAAIKTAKQMDNPSTHPSAI